MVLWIYPVTRMRALNRYCVRPDLAVGSFSTDIHHSNSASLTQKARSLMISHMLTEKIVYMWKVRSRQAYCE